MPRGRSATTTSHGAARVFRLRFAACNYFVGEEELKVSIEAAEIHERAEGKGPPIDQVMRVGSDLDREPGPHRGRVKM